MADFKDFSRYLAGDKRDESTGGRSTKPRALQKQARSRGEQDQSRFDKHVVDAIDKREQIVGYAKWIKRLREGKADVAAFLQGVSADAALELLNIMQSSEKDNVRLAAATELLDRAGLSKLNRHAIAGTLDPATKKEELISMILGLSKGTDEVKIVDDGSPEARPASDSDTVVSSSSSEDE